MTVLFANITGTPAVVLSVIIGIVLFIAFCLWLVWLSRWVTARFREVTGRDPTFDEKTRWMAITAITGVVIGHLANKALKGTKKDSRDR